MTFWIITGILFWGVCGIFVYGRELAYWQRRYPTLAKRAIQSDKRHSLGSACFGPLGLIGCWLLGRGHGIMFKPDWQKEEEASVESFLLPGD